MIATEHYPEEPLYTGIFDKSGCFDVSKKSERMNKFVRRIDHGDLFVFWRYTNNSDIMASMISELLDLKTLRQLSDKIIESMKGEIRPHYFEFLTSASWLSNEEFEDRIVAIQSLRNSTYDYRESAYLATTILICVSRLVRGDKNIFQSICFEYQRYLAVRLRSTMPIGSVSVAKLLREWVPFHQIVNGLL